MLTEMLIRAEVIYHKQGNYRSVKNGGTDCCCTIKHF